MSDIRRRRQTMDASRVPAAASSTAAQVRNRADMLRRLDALGFDISQCADMSDDRLAGWIDECEIVAYRDHTGHLPPDGDEPNDVAFDPAWMDDAYEIACWLTDRHGEHASVIVLNEIGLLSTKGDRDGLRRCGAILQALRDLADAKTSRH